jgi:tRNA A-37 threonylcarbamoyl transferase component Bud32
VYAQEVVKENLNQRYSSSHNAAWLLVSDEFCQAADAAVSCIRNPAESCNLSLLKDSNNRFIFRLKVNSAGPDISSVIVKSFPMKRLKQRLYQYRRYGEREAANLLKAASRGIPVPRVYGYGQIGRFSLIDSTVVMMEDLNRHQSICDLISSVDLNDSGKIELLKRAGRLLVRLYEVGCNHIDISAQSVWLSGADDDDRLIDFHYAAFHSQPSLTVLMFNMAYFVNSVNNLVSEVLLEPWVREVLTELSVTDTECWIELYRQFKSKRLSRKQRLAIK